MKIPFLKTGKFTDVNGKEVTISKEKLDEIIEATKSFAYQDDSFPLVIGHPKLDDPAYGWVKKDQVINENGILVALAADEDINEGFLDIVKKKLFKNVSVKLRKDNSIAHIGFLGAKAPAVTGLPSIAFAEDPESVELEFSEYEVSSWPFRSISRLFRNIKNYLIEKEGLEKANLLLNEYEIDETAQAPRVFEKEKTNFSFSETEGENSKTKIQNSKEEEEMKELDDAKIALAEKDSALAEVNAKLKAFQDQQTADAIAAKKNEFIAFCESDEVKIKIKDGEKDSIVATLMSLDEVEAFEFGEGDDLQKVSPVDVVKNLISRLPNVVPAKQTATNQNAADNNDSVEFSEFAGKNVDTERLELHKKALAIQNAEKISYPEAVRKAIK